jgi:hypothetical protein
VVFVEDNIECTDLMDFSKFLVSFSYNVIYILVVLIITDLQFSTANC